MNHSQIRGCFIAAAGALVGVLTSSAATVTNTFTFTGGGSIPDNAPNGFLSVGTVNLSTVPAIQEVRVGLNLSGTFNGDLYAYIQKGDEGFAVLLNRVGVGSTSPFGYSDAGFSIVFADNAANGDIHSYRTLTGPLESPLTGIWQPDGRNVAPNSAPLIFDDAPRSAMLGSFIDADPSGEWSLFIRDSSLGITSSLNSWSLQFMNTVVPVPEPGTVALLGVGAAALVFGARRRRS
jgi:subtilisin-like proprotein convertase family protein